MKTSKANAHTNPTTEKPAAPTTGEKRKYDLEKAKKAKAKKLAEKVQKSPTSASGFRILNTGDPISESGSDSVEESDDEEVSYQTVKMARMRSDPWSPQHLAHVLPG